MSNQSNQGLRRGMAQLISDNEQGQAALDGMVREMLASPRGRLKLNNLLRAIACDDESAMVILDHDRKILHLVRTLAQTALAGAFERIGQGPIEAAMQEQAESGERAALAVGSGD